MKKTFLVLCCATLVVAACNSGGDKGSKSSDSVGAVTPATPAPDATASSEKGLELIGSSDCTTCHRLHKSDPGAPIGPAYSDVAAKYTNAPDSTVERLVKKVINGGSGVWGSVPMTPHAALDPKDVKTMVQYILTIKNS